MRCTRTKTLYPEQLKREFINEFKALSGSEKIVKIQAENMVREAPLGRQSWYLAFVKSDHLSLKLTYYPNELAKEIKELPKESPEWNFLKAYLTAASIFVIPVSVPTRKRIRAEYAIIFNEFAFICYDGLPDKATQLDAYQFAIHDNGEWKDMGKEISDLAIKSILDNSHIGLSSLTLFPTMRPFTREECAAYNKNEMATEAFFGPNTAFAKFPGEQFRGTFRVVIPKKVRNTPNGKRKHGIDVSNTGKAELIKYDPENMYKKYTYMIQRRGYFGEYCAPFPMEFIDLEPTP